MRTIEIMVKNGKIATWEENKEWDDYAYDGEAIILKNKGCLVAAYSIRNIVYAVVR